MVPLTNVESSNWNGINRLLQFRCVSGFEESFAKWMREEIEHIGFSAQTDPMNNVWVSAGTGHPRRVVLVHLDEIGFVTADVREDGKVWAFPMGNWDPAILKHRVVEIIHPEDSETRLAYGAVIEVVWNKTADGLERILIDVGANNRAEASSLGIRPLLPVVLARESLTVQGNMLISRALDNRLGCAVALSLLRQIAAGALEPSGETIFVFAAQEEVGFRGTWGLARRMLNVHLDAAICVDAFPALREPGLTAGVQAGAGPVLRAADLEGFGSQKLRTSVQSIAAKHGVPLQPAFAQGHNQASVFRTVPGIAIDYPMVGLHSAVEGVHVNDVCAMEDLLRVILKSEGESNEIRN